jgi:drug/metabolite transporter (DMT)-like permease
MLDSMATRTISPINAVLMLCVILFWGSSFVVVKVTLQEGLTPIAIATFRFLTAGGLFVVTLVLNKSRNPDYMVFVEKKDFLKLLLLALTGVTFFFIAQYTGIQMASASIAAIFVCLISPILISVFSARMFKEGLMKKHVLGIGTAAAGTFTVITGGTLNVQGNGTNFLLGSSILLSTPLMWAAYTLMGKKIMEKYDPFLVVAYVNILGGLFLIPFSLAENSFHEAFAMNINEWSAVLFLAFTCSFLGYFIWFHVMNKVKAAVTSSFLFAEPLITVLFATIFSVPGEQITLFTVAGGLLIFTGVYLVTRR